MIEHDYDIRELFWIVGFASAFVILVCSAIYFLRRTSNEQ